MSVQNAGTTIEEARLKAGLTQEQLAEGVCSTLSLSRIENGSAGVSPSTFQALMAHAGVATEAFPIFANRTDFDCFYALKQVRFYLDSWQLQPAWDKLEEIEQMQWGENKFYYQEWLLLHCRLQFRSGCGDHQQIYDTLLHAIHISRPDFDTSNLRKLLLSLPEIELYTLLAQEALYLGNLEMCLEICTQIDSYLANSPMSFLEKDRLSAENAVVYTKYLIAVKDYKNALKTADYHRHKMVQGLTDSPLFELVFLMSLSYYYLNNSENAMTCFKMAFFSAHSIESCYASICHNYVKEHLSMALPDALLQFKTIPLAPFPQKKTMDAGSMGDGTYDLFSPDVLTIGGLIRQLRLSQKLSQTILCQGLCSKSKLSKIENGTLQPEIILAQTLLQRLGISDLIFTFYGSEKESILESFIIRLRQTRTSDTEDTLKLINAIETTCSAKDILYLQYTCFEKSICQPALSLKIEYLLQALKSTLPDFNFKYIQTYRLSWIELTILNNLCAAYVLENPSVGIQCFYKLLEYYDHASINALELRRTLPVTFGMLVRCLYVQNRHAEVQELAQNFNRNEIKSSLYFSGHIFLHYCQSLGELGNLTTAEKYGNYAYQTMLLTGVPAAASYLKEALTNDFQITLL